MAVILCGRINTAVESNHESSDRHRERAGGENAVDNPLSICLHDSQEVPFYLLLCLHAYQAADKDAFFE
jgi:hypothetical protein